MIEAYSQYFTFKELTDSEDHHNLVAQNRLDAKQFALAGKRLSKLLESIRAILGNEPLKVNSGFRNLKLNKAVGSKADGLNGRNLSKHCVFEAADITPSNMSVDEAFNKLIQARKDGKLQDLRKVLQEGTWLHVEVSMSEGDYRGFFVSKDGNLTFEKVA